MRLRLPRRLRRAGGAVIATSDNHGAYPATRPVNIPELAATVYRLMGINTNTDLRIRLFLGDADLKRSFKTEERFHELANFAQGRGRIA